MTTEIEKLERRWHDNPMGLAFAPLAEAYRKSGAVARALELLDTGLAQHPGYVPAHIVRGRCHLDSGERALAELDFLCVAELDPENVIALKALADLAEEEGRMSDAIHRLEALLEIDRANEEAEAQLVRLRADSGLDPGAPGLPGLEIAEVEPLSRDDASTLTPSATRLEGITVYAGDPDLPAVPEGGPEEPLLAAAQGGTPEPEADLRSESLAGLPAELNEWLAEPVAEIPVPTPMAGDETGEGESVFPVAPEPEREPEEPPAAEPDLVVTETMAEIFVRQGHRELALAVYTQLQQREPDNQRIRAAAEALARDLAPGPVEPPAGEPPAPPRRYDAASTGGRAVGDLLTAVLSAGRPRPVQPVHPPAFDRRDGEGAGAASEPSFDEFFAADEPAAPASSPAVAERGDEPESPRGRDAEELEQFHAWLRGLQT